MRLSLPNVPHVQNPDRVAAAQHAIREFGCRAIVLDDGFQHRRLGRDLDIVLLDALEPFGFGHVFPRGTLREPVEGLWRADVVALSRADLLDERGRTEVWQTVDAYAPQAVRAEMVHAPRTLISVSGQQAPLDSLRGQPVGRVLRDWQPGRVPAHACRVRLPSRRIPRVPRPPPLHAGRSR